MKTIIVEEYPKRQLRDCRRRDRPKDTEGYDRLQDFKQAEKRSFGMSEWKKTQCTICGVSCGLEVEVEDNQVISCRADKDSPRSHGYICRKGRNSKYFVEHEDRLDYPMKKVNGEFVRISWDQAIREIGEKLREIVDAHGPRAVCGIGGASGGGQSELVFLKALINGLGGQYMFNPIGFEFMGNWWSHGKIFGDQMCFSEPDDTGCEVLLLWGSNSFVTHQILGARKTIREFSEDPEKLVITVDPRLSETARMSDIHIANRPGTDALLLRGLIALILRKGWENKEYLNKYVADLNQVKPWFLLTDVNECFKVAGVTYEDMEKLARILTTKRWGVHQDLGLFCGRHSTLNSYLMVVLEVICGVALVPGATIVNECWAARGNTINEKDPKVWRTPVTGSFPVLEAYPSCAMPLEMLSEREDRIRAAIRVLGSPMRSYPDANRVKQAFEKLELLVVCEIAWTEDCELADYVLPAKTHFERYEFNAFQLNYPEVVCAVRPPVLERQIAERRDIPEVILDIMKVSGAMPELPQWLYDAGEKAAKTGDRMPYLFKLLGYAAGHMKYFPILSAIVGETLGRPMGSVTRGVSWAALMTSPMAPGLAAKADNPKLGLHPVMEKMPGLDNFCALDAAWEQVDRHPEGAIVGYAESDPEKYIQQHIKHKDHKIHLYCDEVNEALKQITPEKEAVALTPTAEYPFIMSSGRHTEDGLNGMTRNKSMNRYHKSDYTFIMNPEDMAEMGLKNGQLVRVTTSAGSAEIPVEETLQVCRGYAMFPHHYGLKFMGTAEGESGNVLTDAENRDEITGNPCVRYVPCRIEAV